MLKDSATYNTRDRRFEFPAPLRFSFITNPEETTKFFNGIIKFISHERNREKRLFIDISGITELSIDALMYLLAIVNNLKLSCNGNFSFSGNAPADPGIRKLFSESGFYNYVQYQGKDLPASNTDTIQIVSGGINKPEIAKQMSDFVASKAGVSIKSLRFLYIMMVELMSNTHKHAYGDDGIMDPQWYCFAEYSQEAETVSFTFMDTGLGIPSTVRKNFAEKIDVLNLKGENKYVISALKGDFRTSTNLAHRGKGLPKIREFCTTGKIQKMRIITNKADVSVNPSDYQSTLLIEPLRGTIYCWEINLAILKGE